MIEFYPSKLEGAPCETYPEGPQGTIEGWLLANVPTYAPERAIRVSARLNGRLVPHTEWATTECTPDDLLRLYAEPKGAELIIAAVTLGAALTFVTGLFAPNIPKAGGQGGPEGDRLSGAAAKGNQVKLNSPIREVAGRRWVYPDYILPPHRYFVNPRKQVMELLLSVGSGEFQIIPSEILIGDTPAISLGDAVNFAIFNPGQSVAARNEAVWWHSAPEVGATSTGTAGLELNATSGATRNSTALSYAFSGSMVTVPAGSGTLPSDWQPGMLVRIVSPRTYQVTDGGAGRDIVSGDLSELAPFVGMPLEIVGDNEGLYTVNSVTPGSNGSPSTLTGNAAPSRYDFHVTPASFTITRNGQSWSVNLTTNTIDLAGLVSVVNSQLSSAPLTASSSGGFLRISETLPYSGQGINRLISDGATTVFGASPVTVTGTATTDAQMTLNFTDGGGAVTGLQTGAREMAIGYAGMRYRLLAASTSSLTVERLTNTGATDGAWPGFTPLTSSLAVISLDETTLEGGWTGPFSACPEGEVTSEIEIDVFFPGGLVGIGTKKGDIQTRPATVEVQWRPAGSVAPWSSFTKTYVQSTKDQIGFTEKIAIDNFRPEVRMRRIGAKSIEANTSDVVQWYGLRAKLSAPTSYPVTTLAITVGTSDTLASQSESLIGVRATRILPTLPGPVAPTRNPVDWVRHVAHSVGYTDDDLDMTELSRLYAIWAARGDWYDDSREGRTTVFEALVDCLRVGFAVPTLEGGVIRPVRDEPRTVYDDMYSPQNMTGPLQRGFSAVTPDDPDGVDVEFFNETSRQWETVRCRLPGDLGLRAEQLRVTGVTDRTRAWRIGMRRRREIAYRRKTFKFNTEMDALNSGYWGFAALSDDVPGYSQSAQMTGYDLSSRIATVSEPFAWKDSVTHVAAVRRPDGRLAGPFVVTRIDDYRLQFAEPLGFVPVLDLSIELPHVQFGTAELWSYPALLSDISPRGTTGAAVEAVNYDARVYEDDDNSPP